MKILVIGAGPSGLAALKEMREAGFDALACDSRASFGGVFALDSGVTFGGLHLTSSNVFTAYSDFPPYDVDKGAKYWTKAEYYEYLKRYVEHFELADHIQLQTSVDRAHYDHVARKWEVTIRDMNASSTRCDTFDKLIVASGAHHKPYVPAVLDDFSGKVLHSSQYFSPEQVRGKRVLAIGTGEGGSDVASSATSTASSVTVWARRYPDFAPRFVPNFLTDGDYDEHKLMSKYHKPNALLESVTIARSVRTLPLAFSSIALHGLTNAMREKHGLNSTQGMIRSILDRTYECDYYSSDTSLVPTKSAMLPTALGRRLLDLVVTPKVTISENEFQFTDAEVYGKGGKTAAADCNEHAMLKREFDVVIASTGFRLDFSWITTSDPNAKLEPNPRTWFKHCFPEGMGDYLAMVGFARPHSGGIPACSEMVSRYAAQIYLGNKTLPSDYPEQAIADGAAEAECYHQRPDALSVVDYMAYMMSVAKLAGCEPLNPWIGTPSLASVPSFSLSAPSEAVKQWTFPMWPCFFRTAGTGAKPEAVSTVLDAFGTFDALVPMPLLAMEVACGFAMPFVNFGSACVDALLGSAAPSVTRTESGALPSFYKWRMSKMHFLYSNLLSVTDVVKAAPSQILASATIVVHMVGSSVGGLFQPKNKTSCESTKDK